MRAQLPASSDAGALRRDGDVAARVGAAIRRRGQPLNETLQKPLDPQLARNVIRAVLDGGVDYRQERSQFSLEEMMEREVDPENGGPTAIRMLFDYWQERRTAAPPPAAAFDPKGSFTPEQFRWVSWVDVRAADPMNFVFRHHPGFLFGDWSGKSLREYPNPVHAHSLALEYLTCKMIRQPSYHEITQAVGPVRRTYRRLLLPVSDRRQSVSRLYYATRYVSVETGPS
jgi:hypothetical protein